MARRYSSSPPPEPGDHRLGMSLIPRIPSGGLRDGWEYLKQDRPHRWTSLGLAMAIPFVVFYFILSNATPKEENKRSIIYVQSWPATRSDFDVRRDWLNRALQANDDNQARRDAYGRFGNAIGQHYDKEAANREFDEARAQIRKALADLDHAEKNHLPLPPLPVRQEPAKPAAADAPAAK